MQLRARFRPQLTPRAATGLLVLVTALATLSAIPGAQAGCTNYEDYLHWIRTQRRPDLTGTPYVEGTIMYMPTTTGLDVFDVSNDTNPVLMATLALASDYWSLDVRDGLAALAGSAGLALVDVSDPANPQLLSEGDPDPAQTENEVVIGNGFVYLTTASTALLTVSIADPAAPTVVHTLTLPGPGASPLIDGPYLYLGAGNYLVLVNLSVPSAPTLRSSISVDTFYTDRYVSDITKSGTDVFVMTRHNSRDAKLQVYDVSSPAYPARTSDVTTVYPGGTAYFPRVAFAAGVVYVGASTSNYQMFRFDAPGLTNLGLLDYMGGSVGDGNHPGGLNVYGANLYVTAWYPEGTTNGQSHVVSVQSPSPMAPISSVATSGAAQSVLLAPSPNKAGNVAYVANGSGGLQIINIDDPLNPYVIGTVDTPGFATDVTVVADKAYVADGGAGLQIIDVAVPTAPSIIGAIDTPGTAVNLAVADTVAFVADSAAGLQIINVADPLTPTAMANWPSTNSTQGVKLSGTVCYLADGTGGLVALDVSDPDDPWIIGGVKGKSLIGAMKVDVRGDYAYVTNGTTGLTMVDVSDPAFPVALGTADTESTTRDLYLAGIFAFVADDARGVKIINVADPSNPAIVGNAAVPATSLSVYVDGEFAYVAAGDGGLQICPTQCGYDEAIFPDFNVSAAEGFYPHTVQFTNTSVGYGMSYLWDFADGTTSTAESPSHVFTEPGAYDVVLTVTNGTNTETKTMEISAVTEPAVVTAVADVPEDQGGSVYVTFFRSGYDTDGLGKSLEMYTVERLDGQTWVAVATTGAYRRSYYTVLAPTVGDGAASWTTQFRVIAHMEEGNWASAPLSGFSEDNLPPIAPANVAWQPDGSLGWDPAPDNDLEFYRVYRSDTGDFAQAALLGNTTVNRFEITEPVHAWYFVSSVDDAGLESVAAAVEAVSSVPGHPSRVELRPATPNPFNPSTTIAFALPRSGPVRLGIYDVRGRFVRTLVDGELPAGWHSAVWRGDDDSGRRVASGSYVCRLEAQGTSQVRMLMLVK